MKGLPGQGPMQRQKWLRVVGRFDSLHRLALCGELRVPGVRAAIFATSSVIATSCSASGPRSLCYPARPLGHSPEAL